MKFLLHAARHLLIGLSALVLFSASAVAFDVNKLAMSKILPGWTRSDGLRVAAIRIDLAEGWKTYWRAPGRNGIPPAFDWSRSTNLAQVGYFWPAPTVFDTYGEATLGYEERMVLPVFLRPKDPTQPIVARLEMEFGLCLDICIAASAEMTAIIPPAETANRRIIEAAIAARPSTGRSAGLVEVTCAVQAATDGYLLSSELTFSRNAPKPQAVVIESGNEAVWISEPDHHREGSRLSLEADVMNFAGGALAFDRSRVIITIIGQSDAIEVKGCG